MKFIFLDYKKILIILFLFFINLYSLICDENQYYIDSVNLRKFFFKYDYFGDWNKFLIKKSSILQDENGNKFIFSCVKDSDNYIFRFYPVNQGFGAFKYLFDKNKNLLYVMVMLHQDEKTYIIFRHDKPQKFEVYLFGEIFKKNLTYHFPFDSLKVISLYSIITLLEQNDLKKEILINIDDSSLKMKFIKRIIKPSITGNYVTDGARNEFGEFVYIKSGELQKEKNKGFNCSGFVKEVADNYIRLFNSEFGWLNIDDLKMRREKDEAKLNFNYPESKSDPLFGLMWAKNIADKINSLCDYKNIISYEYNSDEYAFYHENRGYNVTDLKEILFRDQLKDSTYFYLIIFNRLYKGSPIAPEYFHLAIIIPYFQNYHFYLNVYESNAETNYNGLFKLHKNEKVLIIKVPIPIQYM